MIRVRVVLCFLERIAAEIEQQRKPQLNKRFAPDLQLMRSVLEINRLPIANANGTDSPAIGAVDKFLARRCLLIFNNRFEGTCLLQVIDHVVAVDVVLVLATVQLDTLLQFFLDVWGTGDSCECRQPVFVRDDAVAGSSSGKFSGPTHKRRYAECAFPVGVLLVPEGCSSAVRLGVVVRSIVGRVQHNRVVGDLQFIDQVEQLANMHIMLNHAVVVLVRVWASEVLMLLFDMRAEVHSCCIPPAEKGFAFLMFPLDESLSLGKSLFVNRFHSFLGQWAGVFDRLPTFCIGLASQDATRTELLPERLSVCQHQIAGVITILWLFFGVEVIQISEELIKAMHGWRMLVEISLMVLSKLICRIALALQNGGHRDVNFLPSLRSVWHTNFGHASSHGNVPADECRASRGTTLLPVVIGEADAFAGNAVDVGRFVAHHPPVVVADIPRADIIAPDDENIRLL